MGGSIQSCGKAGKVMFVDEEIEYYFKGCYAK